MQGLSLRIDLQSICLNSKLKIANEDTVWQAICTYVFMQNVNESIPVVSVIITTYNYSAYLPRAIESALTQTYPNVEIIVVDDGSSDNTASVIPNNSSVKYFYQENSGISGARNNGIKKSTGKYIIFLDADDWLEPDAIENNLPVLINQPNVAFVSGNYYFLRENASYVDQIQVSVNDHHYIRLLQSNYIGMLSAVLFQRWALKEIEFDENMKVCEDYDLYLSIARKYPVLHHQKFIATYYFHQKGLSHNYQSMMDSIKAVMDKQAAHINSSDEKQAFTIGLQQWKDYHELLLENLPNDFK